MGYNSAGPILATVAILMIGCILFWRAEASSRWLRPNDPFCSRFEIIVMSIFGLVIFVALGYFVSDRLVFNYDYYKISKNEALESKETLEEKGYELWSIIDSRPIEKFRIDSCSESPLVTNDEYRKVDVNSEEIKGSYSRLYVFCQTKDTLEN